MRRRILILLHEADRFPGGFSYFIWGLRDAWLEMGLDIRVVKGIDALETADLVIPHVDLTVTPPAYRKALEALPNVVNRGVYDISKRLVSSNLLGPGDPHDGPVIVKTDRNFGGEPEQAIAHARLTGLGRLAARIGRRLARAGGASIGQGGAYPIFESLADVPEQVFHDPGLVVERFLPEQEGGTYFLRWYIFIGDRFRSMRVGSPDPVVRLRRITSTQLGLPIPAEVVALREKWNLDFGKIDFVVHRGTPIILDVNRTPADQPPPRRLELCRPYAPGVFPLLDRRDGITGCLDYKDVDA